MARFGPKRHERDNGVDADRPTRNEVERAARSGSIRSLLDLAAELGVSKDRARTLAFEVDVYDEIRDTEPRDPGTADDHQDDGNGGESA